MANRGRPKVEWVKVNCAACGKELERRASDMARLTTGRAFCSKECQHKVGSKPRRKSEVACRTCGKMFYPRSGNKGIYCSVKCHNTGQTKRTKRLCEVCGREFDVKPSQADKRFCSQECHGRVNWQRVQERAHNGKPVLLTPSGYVKVWEPSRPARRRWVLEHRLVMEQKLGRPLRKDEHVHHLNRDKADNRPENLILVGSSEHSVITNGLTQEQIRRDREELERYRRLFGPLPVEE